MHVFFSVTGSGQAGVVLRETTGQSQFFYLSPAGDSAKSRPIGDGDGPVRSGAVRAPAQCRGAPSGPAPTGPLGQSAPASSSWPDRRASGSRGWPRRPGCRCSGSTTSTAAATTRSSRASPTARTPGWSTGTTPGSWHADEAVRAICELARHRPHRGAGLRHRPQRPSRHARGRPRRCARCSSPRGSSPRRSSRPAATTDVLAAALCLRQHPLVTFWRRLTRDLREHRKPPLVLLRRGWALMRDQRRVIADAEALAVRRSSRSREAERPDPGPRLSRTGRRRTPGPRPGEQRVVSQTVPGPTARPLVEDDRTAQGPTNGSRPRRAHRTTSVSVVAMVRRPLRRLGPAWARAARLGCRDSATGRRPVDRRLGLEGCSGVVRQ